MSFKKFLEYSFNRVGLMYVALICVFLLIVNRETLYLQRLDSIRKGLDYLHAMSMNMVPLDQAKVDEYTEYYQTVLAVLPDNPSARAALGYCYYYKGDIDRAIEYLESAVKKHHYYFWFDYTLAVLYFQQEKYQEAAYKLQMAIDTSVEQAIVFIDRSRVLTYMGYDPAYKEIMEPLFRNPQNFIVGRYNHGKENALKLLVVIYDRMNNPGNVVLSSTAALNYPLEDPAFFFYYAGKASAQLKKYDKALAFLRKSIELNPLRAEPYELVAALLEASGNAEQSTEFRAKANVLREKGMVIDFRPEDLRPVFY